MRDVRIRLPIPFAEQRRMKESKAKRKVVCAGRRGGKTTNVAAIAVEAMLAGYRVLEAAPTADQTNAFWEACCKALREPIAAGVVYKNESERILRLPSTPLVGGTKISPVLRKHLDINQIPSQPRIRAKTAWDADSLRGDYADLLLLDEFSIMKPDVWTEVGAPMLLDNNGNAIFIFTPKRMNHAHRLYTRAMSDKSGRWEAFHFTSLANPYLSKEALAEITADMTEENYKQEILALFLQGQGAVFRNITACTKSPLKQTPAMHQGHRIVIGCDWGKQHDFTAFSIGCATCKQEVDRDRFNKIDYTFQMKRLKTKCDIWKPYKVLTELNSIGQPIFEQLAQMGLPVEGFVTTASTKPPLIENLALVLDRTEWQFQDDQIWTGELEAYEGKPSALTGRMTYSAPEGEYDDTVICRALMVWQAAQPQIFTAPLILTSATGWVA